MKDQGSPLGEVSDLQLISARLNAYNAALERLQAAMEHTIEVATYRWIGQPMVEPCIRAAAQDALDALQKSREYTIQNLS